MNEKMGELYDLMTTLYMAAEPTPMWDKAFKLIGEIAEEMSAVQDLVTRMNEVLEDADDTNDDD